MLLRDAPATDLEGAAEFYRKVFGWGIRRRSDGSIVQPVGPDAPEITARFRDPGGNVVGLDQQPGG